MEANRSAFKMANGNASDSNVTNSKNCTTALHICNGTNEDAGAWMPQAAPPGLDFLLSTIIIGVLILVGNVLVCLVFKADRRLRRTTNIFIVSLAINDILVAVVYIPVYIHDALTGQQTNVQFIVCFIWFLSILNHCGMAFDRFQNVSKPLHYNLIMTRRRVVTVLALIWTLPLINTFIPVFVIYNPKISPMATQIFIKYFIFADVSFIFLCTLMILASYVILFIASRRHVKSEQKSLQRNSTRRTGNSDRAIRHGRKPVIRHSLHSFKAEVKAARVFFVVVLTHFVCWLPMIYSNICELVVSQKDPSLLHRLIPIELRYVVYYSFICNSCMNPLIYSLLRKEFRDGLKKLFHLSANKDASKLESLATQPAHSKNHPEQFQLIVSRATSMNFSEGIINNVEETPI